MRLSVNWIRIILLVKKEFTVFFCTRMSVVMLVVPLVLQALLFGYVATFDLNHTPYAVLDCSHGQLGEDFLRHIDSTKAFYRIKNLNSPEELAATIESGEAMVAIVLEQNMDKKLLGGEKALVQVITDGRFPLSSGLALRYISNIAAAYNQQMSGVSPALTVETQTLYNANQISMWSLCPGYIAVLALIEIMQTTARVVAGEKDKGTYEQLLMTPLSALEILIGKAVTVFITGTVYANIGLAIYYFWFCIPFAGSYWLLLATVIVFNISIVGIALFVCMLAETLDHAYVYVFICIIPLMALSGLITPIENMPQWLKYITYANPMRYAVEAFRCIMLEGAGAGILFRHYWLPLSAMAVVTLPLTYYRLERSMK